MSRRATLSVVSGNTCRESMDYSYGKMLGRKSMAPPSRPSSGYFHIIYIA